MKKMLFVLFSAIVFLRAADIDQKESVHIRNKPSDKTTVIFSDGKKWNDAEIDVLKVSETLRNMGEDIGNFDDMQVNHISSKLFIDILYPLMKIAKNKNMAQQEPLSEKDMRKKLKADFRALNFDEITELLKAANFFDIQPALQLLVDRCVELLPLNSRQFAGAPEQFIQSVGIPSDLQPYFQKSPRVLNKIWSVFMAKPIATLKDNYSPIFSPNGKLLATVNPVTNLLSRRSIKIWDTETWKVLRTLIGHKAPITDIAFSPDGKLLAAGYNSGMIKLWDVQTETVSRTLTGHASAVGKVVFSPDGSLLAAASKDMTVKVWDTRTLTILNTLTDHRGEIKGIAFSPDGTLLITGSPHDKDVKVWNVQTWKLSHSLPGHTDGIRAVCFSKDGKLLATGSADNTAKVWDTRTWTVLSTLAGHTKQIQSISFSPGGTILATKAADGTAKVWDVPTGTLLHTLTGFKEDSAPSISFSPNGALLATGSYDMSKLWKMPVSLPIDILLTMMLLTDPEDQKTDLSKAKQFARDKIKTIGDKKTRQILQNYFDGLSGWPVPIKSFLRKLMPAKES